ncbi:tRNA pseudouridine synthase 3 [Nannizzia gypsea CBS 118893]|uniref:tRNA pseudouridine synthase 3 n=1 Tax=Arthroderma gypseum (strain ATCC MYA-4604 / CBS 118893) TaxID=535722 RepID=E5R091_ARTGP|nr:tRNA pseudouridine synthase 3 [Nannizzia gypsea CBS 118893]EFQ98287.1 tRNA pseudouridine synthase 3 [Nannizzia gypsea CBS 118893]
MAEESSPSQYSGWSNASLINRIHELERQLNECPQTSVSAPSTECQSLEKKRGQTERTTADNRPRERSTSTNPPRKSDKKRRKIDPSRYSTRHIAIKFAYLGKRYNGLEHANGNFTEVPTIEEELWKALRKTRLIFPTHKDCTEEFSGKDSSPSRPYSIHWDGCQYSKCGRTDKGVSAFGQVIGIRVRSLRPADSSPPTEANGGDAMDSAVAVELGTGDENRRSGVPGTGEAKAAVWDDIADELPYIQILNGALPEDIRVLAWCPHLPADFDARFSCRQRRYRYFFTQPAFCPTPGARGIVRAPELKDDPSSPRPREGWLDIEAMREAAQYFVGSHDFRNFCKVDTSKQITNFVRRILRADLELVDPQRTPLGFVQMPGFERLENSPRNTGIPEGPNDINPAASKVYSFTVHGTAFLWHQIRHMVGILFLVGQGLEHPSIVPELLDVTKNPRRPVYEMASDSPLVLWDCIFGEEEDELDWVYPGDPRTLKTPSRRTDGNFGQGGLVEDLWTLWRNRKIDELLAGTLLESMANRGQLTAASKGDGHPSNQGQTVQNPRVFSGGDNGKPVGKYVPLLNRTKLDLVEDMNARYLSKKGHKYWNKVLEYQEEQRKAAFDAE